LQAANVLIPEKIFPLKFAGTTSEVFHAFCKTTEAQAPIVPPVIAIKL
jgi:hypothetical protein